MAQSMTKKEFLEYSFKNKLYLNRDWVLSSFSVASFVNIKKPGVLHKGTTYTYFINGNSDEEIIISDAPKEGAVFSIHEKLEVLYGFLSNIEKPTVTTLGNLLFNACCIDYAFGKKLGYLNSKKTANIVYLEEIISKRLTSVRKDESDKNLIFVDEYLKFAEGMQYLQGFNFIFCECVTEKLLTTPPNNEELKKQLLAKYADSINTPATLATVIKALEDNDKEFLKGDSSENFLIGKSNVARRKMFLMQGGEPSSLTQGDTIDISTNSLSQGIQVSKFATLNNISRSGSYNRGFETQLGGVVTKDLIRSTSAIQVVRGDCLTKYGRTINVNEENYVKQLVGFSIMENNTLTMIEDKEQAGKYIGKVIQRRASQYCISPGDTYCEICVGKRLAMHPKGVSMAITEIGGTLLGIFMSAMHAKDLKVHNVNIDSVTR